MARLAYRVIGLAGVGLILLSAFGVTSAFAQSDGTQKSIDIRQREGGTFEPSGQLGRTLALLVGVNEYRNVNIPKLQFAVTDVEAIRDRFVARIPSTKSVVNLLINENASRDRVLRGIDEIAATATPGDAVLIYLSLHGKTDKSGRKGYLVSYDADVSDIERTGLAVDDMLQRISRINARKVFVLLDACYSGSAMSGTWAAGARSFSSGPTARAILSDDIYDQVKSQRGHFLLSASRPDEPALELHQLGHGLFTYFVLKGVEGAAARQGSPYVTVSDLYDYVSRNVADFASGLKRKQTPMMEGKYDGAPPILTQFDVATFRPDRGNLTDLIEQARRSFESSRVVITANGSDTIEIYVDGKQQGSWTKSEIDYRIPSDEFVRLGGKQAQVRVVAVPSSGDRKREEQAFVVEQGTEHHVSVQSSERPKSSAPKPPRAVRVPPPMF